MLSYDVSLFIGGPKKRPQENRMLIQLPNDNSRTVTATNPVSIVRMFHETGRVLRAGEDASAHLKELGAIDPDLLEQAAALSVTLLALERYWNEMMEFRALSREEKEETARDPDDKPTSDEDFACRMINVREDAERLMVAIEAFLEAYPVTDRARMHVDRAIAEVVEFDIRHRDEASELWPAHAWRELWREKLALEAGDWWWYD